MKGIFSWWKVLALAVAGSAAGTTALAQWHMPDQFRGVVNDHPVSPSSSGSTVWELRGPWSLDVRGDSRTANFSAALTMEYSDVYMGSVAAAATDARHQHTHIIKMNDATVIESPGDCPTDATPYPTYTWQFEVTGNADVTGNGGSPFAGPVPLQVCIGGGPDLKYSNITLVFGGSATAHFGPQAIHGVVGIASAGSIGRGR
jgi:hypothetical protein